MKKSNKEFQPSAEDFKEFEMLEAKATGLLKKGMATKLEVYSPEFIKCSPILQDMLLASLADQVLRLIASDSQEKGFKEVRFKYEKEHPQEAIVMADIRKMHETEK